ncbi:MAG: hypothetical protein FWC39_11345 [Bacteroidetes bacterium]|nr:hypothetical protein [Bacteroidota bacterium]
MYTPKYFKAHELVPKEVYDLFIDETMIFGIFDENALRILDLIREWSGVGLTVNNWFWKGNRNECGFRPNNTTTGATQSAHKYGKGFDIISPKLTTVRFWDLINENASKLPCKIRIERTNGGKPIGWLHFDTMAAATQKDKVYYFNA